MKKKDFVPTCDVLHDHEYVGGGADDLVQLYNVRMAEQLQVLNLAFDFAHDIQVLDLLSVQDLDCHLGGYTKNTITECPRILDQIHTVTYYKNLVKTSWRDGIVFNSSPRGNFVNPSIFSFLLSNFFSSELFSLIEAMFIYPSPPP